MGHYSAKVRIIGDATGARLDARFEQVQLEASSHRRLTAAEVESLWRSLDEVHWWATQSCSTNILDAGGSSVYLRRGTVIRCAEGSRDPPAVAILRRLADVHGLKEEAVAHSPRGQVLAAFEQGDLQAAEALAAKFSEVDTSIPVLRHEIASFDLAHAAADSDPVQWTVAFEIDRRISQGKSAFSNMLRQKALPQYLQTGRAALDAGDSRQAIASLKEACSLDRTNAEARNALASLQAQAEDLYNQGAREMKKNPDAARAKFERVMATTPEFDTFHTLAEDQLRALVRDLETKHKRHPLR